ncbi:hypothetical protein WJX84_008796 [Apatococcus fuscideae]|uniref:SS18 N-terminal domain-containing protein n=1 Tax=Apatococcus fuscideae TaxID=2026836 RepID=A0AAW1T1A3_9CHLO
MQSIGAGNPAGASARPTTETIQQMLEENQRFIQATMEHQNAGNLHAAAQYQQRLQQNLISLRHPQARRIPPSRQLLVACTYTALLLLPQVYCQGSDSP